MAPLLLALTLSVTLGNSNDFEWGNAALGFQPAISEVQSKHSHEGVDQNAKDLGRLLIAPHRGQCQHADEIVEAVL